MRLTIIYHQQRKRDVILIKSLISCPKLVDHYSHEINKLVVNVLLIAIVFIHGMLIIIMPPKMDVVMGSGVFVLVHALG